MKRIIAVMTILFLVLPGFVAAAPGGEQAGDGKEHPVAGDRQQMRAEENEAAGERQRVAFSTTPGGDEIVPEQNRVRLAVHALLAVENRTGGIGKNISAIAREINNSVQVTCRAEEQIRARHSFMRFLFGGDRDAARLIEEEAQRNLERAVEFRRAIGNCTCDNETRTLLQEQIRTVEQEQVRLMALADAEFRHQGLLVWR